MTAASWILRRFQALAAPGWRARATAAFFGSALGVLAPRKGRIESNLSLVYPDKGRAWRARIRHRLYGHLAWTVTELMVLQRDPRQALRWVEEVEGLHWVEECRSQGRGVLFLSAHFGNWELLAAWYAQVCKRDGGPGFHIVSQEIHDRGISDLLREYRERCGIGLLPKDTSTLEFVRLLREGAHIALLADISWLGGVRLPFMGHECTNTTGPAVLSILASVPIVPVGIYRLAPFRHRVRFFPPLPVPEERNRLRRAELLTLEVNRALEEIIAPRPELWFWMHNRWKT